MLLAFCQVFTRITESLCEVRWSWRHRLWPCIVRHTVIISPTVLGASVCLHAIDEAAVTHGMACRHKQHRFAGSRRAA